MCAPISRTLQRGFSPQQGFSIVELMVAVVISLVATLVIFETFAVSEGIKRTSTSGGDAQEGDVAVPDRASCAWRATVSTARCWAARSRPTQRHRRTMTSRRAPVMIEPGAATRTTDHHPHRRLNLLSDPATIAIAMSSATDAQGNNRWLQPGDLPIAAEPGQDCTAEATHTPSAPRDGSHFHDTGSCRFPGQWHDGTPTSLGPGHHLQHCGHALQPGGPQRNQYRIEDNRLVVERLLGTLVPPWWPNRLSVQSRIRHGRRQRRGTADDGTYYSTQPAPRTAGDACGGAPGGGRAQRASGEAAGGRRRVRDDRVLHGQVTLTCPRTTTGRLRLSQPKPRFRFVTHLMQI